MFICIKLLYPIDTPAPILSHTQALWADIGVAGGQRGYLTDIPTPGGRSQRRSLPLEGSLPWGCPIKEYWWDTLEETLLRRSHPRQLKPDHCPFPSNYHPIALQW